MLCFLVGWVFLSEDIQKFLFPAALGVGRFEKIGIPAPRFTGPFVGIVEIVGVSEIALASVLIIGAGLLIRSFGRLLDEPEGFNPERLLSLEV